MGQGFGAGALKTSLKNLLVMALALGAASVAKPSIEPEKVY